MNEFRTVVSVREAPYKIGLGDGVFAIGSCFADAIAQRLKQNKFSGVASPFGVLYNPISIDKALVYASTNRHPDDNTFVKRADIFLNYDFHSAFSSLNEEDLRHQIASTIESSHMAIKSAKWVLITYGTAWLYTRNDCNEIVANCHKLPSSQFGKKLASVEEIVNSFTKTHALLSSVNPDLRIILTVSPVRHVKETLELNSVSKAILRMACHTLASSAERVEYFPAYEIMMDDLRDYRFYKADLLHPTEVAEDYIWKKFGERFFDASTTEFIQTWSAIRAALSHRPFHSHAAAHQQFLRATLVKLTELKSIVNVDQEIAQLQEQLI